MDSSGYQERACVEVMAEIRKGPNSDEIDPFYSNCACCGKLTWPNRPKYKVPARCFKCRMDCMVIHEPGKGTSYEHHA